MEFRKTQDDPKSPMIIAQVPRGALIQKGGDEDGFHVLNVVTMRELSGEEEDMLADEKQDVMAKLYGVVSSCIVALSDGKDVVVDDLRKIRQLCNAHPSGFLMSDMLTLLFRLREVTVGDEYRQAVTCPACEDDEGRKFSWTHIGSLTDLEVVPASGNLEETSREFTTSRGNIIKWTMLTAVRHIESTKKKTKKDKATTTLMLRVESINGEKATLEILKKMSFRERTEIRKQFDDEGGIDTMVPVVCRNCGHEFTVGLEIAAQDFFFPSDG